MTCAAICPREVTSRDEASPGVIGSDETICRSLYPSDRNTGGVKRSAIPASHLWDGTVSVWRVSALSGLTVTQLADLLDHIMVRDSGEKFDQIRAVVASSIRSFSVNDVRACSLLDECTMNRSGDKHPAHAHIAICEVLRQQIARNDETFRAVQEGIKLLFEPNQVWARGN
jgi:hypothetical protein